jgi:hypothetical protein
MSIAGQILGNWDQPNSPGWRVVVNPWQATANQFYVTNRSLKKKSAKHVVAKMLLYQQKRALCLLGQG